MWAYNSFELYHFGIKGMHWGVRRYQNYDGTLTAEGRKKYRKQLREDNQKAYSIGKKATGAAYAAKAGFREQEALLKKARRLEAKGHSVENSKRLSRTVNELNVSQATTKTIVEGYHKYRRAAETIHDELVSKYGKENVSDIRMKNGVINEHVNNGKAVLGGLLFNPWNITSKTQLGNEIYTISKSLTRKMAKDQGLLK